MSGDSASSTRQDSAQRHLTVISLVLSVSPSASSACCRDLSQFRPSALAAPAGSLSRGTKVPQSRTNAARHARVEACRAAEVIDVASGLGRNRAADTRIFRSCATWSYRGVLRSGRPYLERQGPSVWRSRSLSLPYGVKQSPIPQRPPYESPRDSRRLHFVRRWSHGKRHTVLPRGA